MSVQWSGLKDLADCGCGMESCTAYGVLKKPNRDGTRCVARLCKCPRCRGRSNRKRGLAKQRDAAKALGISGYLGNEENWSDNMFQNEVKADLQNAKPVGSAWLRCVKQIDQNRPDFGGMGKPSRVTFMPPGWGSRGLVVVDTETWAALVRPALEQFYGSDT